MTLLPRFSRPHRGGLRALDVAHTLPRMVDTMSRFTLSSLSLSRWERAALTVWFLILLGIGTRVVLHPDARTTYPIFSASARLWWQGQELYFPYRPESV